jgi:hypothetical protein
VDKDKLLPALRKRVYRLMEDSEHSQGSLAIAAEEIDKLIEEIECGMYDWQQGSE